MAAAAGAIREVIGGAGFAHVAFTRNLSSDVSSLHVYFGGDGRAFTNRYRVARDPTPANPLALELMLTDAAPAAYLGRPCYHGAPDSGCQPNLWTSHRYSEAVVASMTHVLRELTGRAPQAEVTLIGYSGGGVLALLVGARSPRVGTVITIAAPLDLGAWTHTHRYTPLHGSIDPAQIDAWPASLRQLHVYGADDRNVPPRIAQQFVTRARERGLPALLRVIDGFDHVCCWRETWPRLLDALAAGAAAPEREKSWPSG